MFSELEENKKVYDEDELEAEVMKLKQIHIREPGMEDPPPPPCKKQKRWHNSRKKKRKPNEAFEKESNQIETEAVDPPKLFEKLSEDLEKKEVIEEESKLYPVFDPNKVFVFNAPKKNVKSNRAKRKSSKGLNKTKMNPILNYFTTGRSSSSQQTNFPEADNI